MLGRELYEVIFGNPRFIHNICTLGFSMLANPIIGHSKHHDMRHAICFLILLFCFSCGQDQQTLKPLNLLKYGLAVTIEAPDSAKVKTSDMGIMKDITVIDGDGKDYSLQIFSSQAMSVDVAQIKADQITDAKKNPYFSKIIREDDNGFIYETTIDSTLTNYWFKYIQIMGDQEIIFQPGMGGSFSLEQVERMYESVKKK